MPEMQSYVAGVPCWVETLQRDVSAAKTFYSSLFGWQFAGPGAMPDGGEYFVAQLRGLDVAGIGTLPAQAPQTPAWTTYVQVENVVAAAKAVSEAGGYVAFGPASAAPAGKFAVVLGSDDAAFGLWEPHERRGAQLVNESFTWTMSQLNTIDVDLVGRFYENVFGWQVQEIGDAAPGFYLVRLPGYEGGVAEQPVPRDVVAVMSRLNRGLSAGSYWSVDFRVDDVGAAVKTAESLGGKVRVPQFETPFSRNAVLQDQQGAAFGIHSIKKPDAT